MKYSDNYEFSLPSKADGDSADIDPISENFKQIDSILKNIYTKLASQIVFLAENEISLETSPEDIPYGINVCFVNKSSFVNGLVQIGTLIALKNENLDRHTYQVDEFWIGNTTLVPMQRKSVKTDEGEKVWQEWQRLATEDTVTAYINSFAESENIFKQHILEKLSEIDKRTVNLEQGITPSPFETDDTVAYSKIVPENALPYAEISKVGGMTRKTVNLANIVSAYNATVSNGVATQIEADTNNSPYLKLQQTSNGVLISNKTIAYSITIGKVETTFDLLDGVDTISFGVNGSKVDTFINIDVKDLPRGQYAFSCEFTNITQGSISWKDNQLNPGQTALPYEPYFEGLRSAKVTEVKSVGADETVVSTLPIPEAVRPKHGINESVYDYIDLDKEQSVKRCREKVFDGTEGWTLQSVNANGLANFLFNGLTNASTTIDSAICNLFDADYSLISAATKEGFLISTSENVYFRSKRYSTVSDWKAYLAELYASGNPLVLVYVLATPEVTDISDILSDDNYIAVEGGGTVTMVNEFEYAVPSEITYQIKGDAI